MTGIAAQYEAKFSRAQKWVRERAAVAELLHGLPPGSTVLDCPVGTGRFLPLYEERGLFCFGIDVSPEMIRSIKLEYGQPVRLEVGDLFELDYQVHVAVCVRFLGDHLDPGKLREALAALRRCAPTIICGLRYGGRKEPGKWAHSRESFEEAVKPYRVERRIALDDRDYWMHLCRA